MIQKFLRATAVSATVTVLEFTYHTVDALHVPLYTPNVCISMVTVQRTKFHGIQ